MVTVRPKKAKEAGKQTPYTREEDISSHKDSTFEKEEPEAMEKQESQEDQTIRQQSKEAPGEGGGATSETEIQTLAQGSTRFSLLASHGQLTILSGGEG